MTDKYGVERPVVDVYGDFRGRFGAFVRVRNALVGRRIRAHVFSGIEFQMFVFIVGPVTGWIVGTTLISAALLIAFELLLIFKLWTATRASRTEAGRGRSGGDAGGAGAGAAVTRPRFEELAWRATPIGEISLRRRLDPLVGVEVYEVKIDDEFLMSSLFTVAEVELARLGLAAARGDRLDVVVGGLGLGYTARAALEDPRVRSLLVVEALDEVIAWHERGLLPFAAPLTTDPRSRLVEADFFAMAAAAEGFDPARPGGGSTRSCSTSTTAPGTCCAPANAALYTPAGLRRLARHLRAGGVFALWSDDPPDAAFEAALAEVFATAASHVVPFANPITGGESANTVYVATPRRRLENPVQQRDVVDRLEAGLRVQLAAPWRCPPRSGTTDGARPPTGPRPPRARAARGPARRGASPVRRRGRAPARRSAG